MNDLRKTIEEIKNLRMCVEEMKNEISKIKVDFREFAHSKDIYILNPHQKESETTARCNFHCHSTNSDGYWSPEDMLRQYKAAGYDLIGIADHRYITYVEDSPLIYIPNCESYSDDSRRHWLMINIPKRENLTDDEWEELLMISRGGTGLPEKPPMKYFMKFCKKYGILTGIAHPWVCYPDCYEADYDFFELCNKGGRIGHNYEETLSETLIKTNYRRFVLINDDDCHVRPTFTDDASHTIVNYNGEKNANNILEAMKMGRCYPTIGNAPKIKITVSKKTVIVEADTTCIIEILTESKVLSKVKGTILKYDVSTEPYIRVRAYYTTNNKNTVYSNIIYSQILWSI